jgi:hypothetical protein
LKIVKINSVETIETNLKDIQYWKDKFPSVFSGKIGKLKDFQLKLHIDTSVKPIQARPRNHPFHLLAAINAEIELMLKEDIIEEVSMLKIQG